MRVANVTLRVCECLIVVLSTDDEPVLLAFDSLAIAAPSIVWSDVRDAWFHEPFGDVSITGR
jgi:hypothetical protein